MYNVSAHVKAVKTLETKVVQPPPLLVLYIFMPLPLVVDTVNLLIH